MKMKKMSQQVTTQVVNEDGLQKLEHQVNSFLVEREPDYVKLYIDDIVRLNDMPKSSTNILLAVVKRMTYNNDIVLISPIKKDIAEELGIKEVTLRKAIELFVENSILIRKGRGLYIVNPYFFGKGKWEEIKKIRLKITYSKSGRMILKSELEYKNEEVQSNSESE